MPQTDQSHRFRPCVVAARRGRDHSWVYLTEADRWTTDIAEAELIEDEAHGDIRLLEAGYASAGSTGIRLVTVRMGASGPEFLTPARECA